MNQAPIVRVPLRAAGHGVDEVTLTGERERAQLRHPGITLAMRVADKLLDAEPQLPLRHLPAMAAAPQ